MYSELVGIDVDGKLRQWQWNERKPYKNEKGEFHPKTGMLQTEGKKVTELGTYANMRMTSLLYNSPMYVCMYAKPLVGKKHTCYIDTCCMV